MRPDGRRARTVLALLLVASFTVITLDARRHDGSPVDPLRTVAGAVFGPLENGAATVLSPLTRVSRYLTDVEEVRAANARLRRENSELRSRLRTTAFARNRAQGLDRLLTTARRQDHSVVTAQVTAMGGAQTFARTVTIDAGRQDGVRPDMTVLNGDGLVGRVLSASPSSASVLLIVDPDSVVGGRVGRSMELGFVSGEGDIDDAGRLTMELVDRRSEPRPGDSVVTWGSKGGAPYVAGVPIGSVTHVRTSPRELSKSVVIDPYVDFSSLDVVGVVVGPGGDGRVAAMPGGDRR